MERLTLEDNLDLTPYRALRSHFWLKGSHNIETRAQTASHGRRLRVDYPNPDTLDSGKFGALFAGLLVRDEYPEMCGWILRELEEPRPVQERSRGLLVYGQAGIGKTFFLYYALAFFLSIGTPVAWCCESDYWLLFDSEDVHLRSYVLPKMSDKTVALFDQCHPPKSNIYCPGSPCDALVVQASSDATRFRKWTQELGALFWVMKPWSLEEVKQEAALRASHRSPAAAKEASICYSPETKWDLLGSSARVCFTATRETGSPVEDFGLVELVQRVFGNDPTTWAACLDAAKFSFEQQQGSAFYQLFVVFPTTPGTPSMQIPLWDALIPTRFLRRLVVNHLHKLQADQYVDFASAFANSPQTVAIALEARASKLRDRKRNRRRR